MSLISKSLDTPDEKRTFEHGDMGLVSLPGATVIRTAFRPGWRWSKDVKPQVGTDSCHVPHTGVVLAGRFHVRMDDGREQEFGPGDAFSVGPGHDAWVVGDETYESIDFGPAPAGVGGRVGRCPCGVEFRVSTEDQVDHLVAAIQEHALGSHDHSVTREHVLGELTAS